MNTIVNTVNAAGQAFVDFALPMLIQSGVLVLILLLIDFLLRRRVRAVFRYWIWMLVLLKLVLPPSLGSPFSIGTWFGETLEAPTVALQETPAPAWQPEAPLGDGALLGAPLAKGFALDAVTPVVTPPAPQTDYAAEITTVTPTPAEPTASVGWQALVLLAWMATVLALLLLLLQRAFFVRSLVAQAQEAPPKLLAAMDACRGRVGLTGPVALRLSPNATSPAVCGLWRPVILIPKNLAPKLQPCDLQAVLLHELAHVKRGDLWVNLIQTLLQIAYFYNPLLWLANVAIRRIREQAVDEAVLVAMGETARDYPETLLNVAKLAFRKRPTLSLRLIGVVESKSALTARIKHILSRPFPKTAKLGLLGLAVVFLIAAVLLPMAKARPMTDRARHVMTLAREEARQLNHSYVGTEHILLALARRADAVSAMALANLGAGIDTLRAEVGRLLQPGSEPVTRRRLPRTPRAKRVFRYARQEARSLGHDYIGTEHILLGLTEETNSIAAQVLTGLDLTPAQIRAEVLKFVQSEFERNTGYLVKFTKREQDGFQRTHSGRKSTWRWAYDVQFAPHEELVVVAELYQAGRPMKRLGHKVFHGTPDVQTLRGTFTRTYQNKSQTLVMHTGRVELGGQVLEIPEFTLDTERAYPDTSWATYQGDGLRRLRNRSTRKDYAELEPLFCYGSSDGRDLSEGTAYFWIPGNMPSPTASHHAVVFKMIPASRLHHMVVEAVLGWQGLDGRIMPRNTPIEYVRQIEEKYKAQILNLVQSRSQDSGGDSDEDTGRSAVIEPDKPSGVLEFRIAPKSEDLGSETVDRYKRALAGGGRVLPDNFTWFPLRTGTTVSPDLIGQEHEAIMYLLLWNKPSHTMLTGQPWGLENVDEATDAMGRRAIRLTLNEEGASLFHEITKANVREALAIVLGSEVVSMPHIAAPFTGRSVLIAGNFTDQEIDGMIAALSKDLRGLFIIQGTVTDESGRPLSGVEMTARCGFENLPLADRTLTDQEGRYTLRFSHTIKVPDADPYEVGIQRAPIEARMNGFHEVDLCRQGNLAIAGQAPGLERQRFVHGYAGVVLPGEPYELDFVMRPTARIEGQILDEAGSPILRPHVWLHSDKPLGKTPPYGITRSNGWFTIESIPCGSFWFTSAQTYPARSDTMTLPRPGTYRVTLQYGQFPSGRPSLRIVAFQTPAFDRSESVSDQPRVVDPNGDPVAGAQVALCTKDQGVVVRDGRLDVNRMGAGGSTLVETDGQGRFSFADEPEAFHLVTAHEKGFAWVTNEQLATLPEVRLQSWGRIDGTLYIGRERGVEKRMGLMNYINKNAIDQRIRYDYEAHSDPNGRFVFDKVPPGWMEVGYLIRVGGPSFPTSTYTARTPLQVLPGKTTRVPIGGRGRPVVGKFVPQADYDGPVYFGGGLRALYTVRPERPTPDNYEQMTKREQQEWIKQWYKTDEAKTYLDAVWHDPQHRHYSFRIQGDGTFRIEDVIPGKYKFTVWLEERFTSQGHPEEIGAYYETVEVPPMAEAYSDEPLDLGELVVHMRAPLHVGDTAPLFEARTLDGNDICLADYRGKFVLLSFWQPTFHPELDRLKELYATYGGTGKLQIIGLGGSDTLDEVKNYVAEHETGWPQIYFGEQWDQGIAKEYGLPGLPYILLVDPEGKIIATWLRGEKLTTTVREALGETD